MLVFCLIGVGLIILGITFVMCNATTINEDEIDNYLKQRKNGK